jgi:hypothetical protein
LRPITFLATLDLSELGSDLPSTLGVSDDGDALGIEAQAAAFLTISGYFVALWDFPE